VVMPTSIPRAAQWLWGGHLACARQGVPGTVLIDTEQNCICCNSAGFGLVSCWSFRPRPSGMGVRRTSRRAGSVAIILAEAIVRTSFGRGYGNSVSNDREMLRDRRLLVTNGSSDAGGAQNVGGDRCESNGHMSAYIDADSSGLRVVRAALPHRGPPAVRSHAQPVPHGT